MFSKTLYTNSILTLKVEVISLILRTTETPFASKSSKFSSTICTTNSFAFTFSKVILYACDFNKKCSNNSFVKRLKYIAFDKAIFRNSKDCSSSLIFSDTNSI